MNLDNLAEKIAFFLVQKEIIQKQKIEIYIYGFELLLSTICNGILLIIISIFLHVFWQTILMIIPFIIIRSNAGGFHAQTHAGCMIGFMAVYVFCILFAKNLPNEILLTVALSILTSSSIVVLAIGVVPHKNRSVTPKEIISFKNKTRMYTTTMLLIGLVGLYILPTWFVYFTFGISIAAGSLLVEFTKNRLERRWKNEYS